MGSNTAFATAQVVSVPTAVDGAVPNLSWQFFKFPAQAGQRLSIEVLARRIGSSLDPMIRLLDIKGRELAFNDDTPGLNGDSSLTYTFKDAGEYVVEIGGQKKRYPMGNVIVSDKSVTQRPNTSGD